MAQINHESIMTSFSAKKYNSSTKAITAYTPDANGKISVTNGDEIRFFNYSSNMSCEVNCFVIYAYSDFKFQINANASNPVKMYNGDVKQFSDLVINSIKALSDGTIYYEALSFSPRHDNVDIKYVP
jgi:hypothetical protein